MGSRPQYGLGNPVNDPVGRHVVPAAGGEVRHTAAMPSHSDPLFEPPQIAKLPLYRGHRVPWFVSEESGVPDHRVVRRHGLSDAYQGRLCWICGERRGNEAAFPIGPMCAINRISSEPPSHVDCAIYSVKACPHLTKPHMRRRTTGLPSEIVQPAGTPVQENPGVTAVWLSTRWRPQRVGHGVLFDIGEPAEVLWYTEGREATRAEAARAMQVGIDRLKAADAEDPHGNPVQLAIEVYRAWRLLPKEVT
jgi:hypothetical protein